MDNIRERPMGTSSDWLRLYVVFTPAARAERKLAGAEGCRALEVIVGEVTSTPLARSARALSQPSSPRPSPPSAHPLFSIAREPVSVSRPSHVSRPQPVDENPETRNLGKVPGKIFDREKTKISSVGKADFSDVGKRILKGIRGGSCDTQQLLVMEMKDLFS